MRFPITNTFLGGKYEAFDFEGDNGEPIVGTKFSLHIGDGHGTPTRLLVPFKAETPEDKDRQAAAVAFLDSERAPFCRVKVDVEVDEKGRFQLHGIELVK